MSYAIAYYIVLKEGNYIYKDHSEFKLPLNEDEKIWRYLDFTKFVSLLCNHSLFFCRADEIAKLDRFEGTFSSASIKALISATNTKKPDEDYETLKQMFGLLTRALRKCTVISCWHKSEIESDAMWKLYVNNGLGVAIQSTTKNLKESFKDYADNSINIGLVNYIDYDFMNLLNKTQMNIFTLFMNKREGFSHENELRALISRFNGAEIMKLINELKSHSHLSENDFNNSIFKGNGLYVPTNLDILIEKVVVCPIAPKWFNELVQAIVIKYNLNKEVVPSSLIGDPIE